jgi:protein dithiol oxidoreductase (disulfide-forming)
MSIRTSTLALMPWLLAAALAVNAPTSLAQPVEGTDYKKLVPPQPTDSPGRIEVIEFFSYGCPHCNAFYPLINAWAAKLPKDVVFKRVAVSFNRPQWISLARAYYALQATGDLPALDGALFHALHAENLKLFDEPSLASWVGSHGGNAEQFTQAYTSFGVNSQTVQADQLAERYLIDAIPALAVNGTYLAIADSTHGQGVYFTELIAHTDALIARVRSETPARSVRKEPEATGKAK